ncbi:MAG: ATP-dependent sacrificial sulfur transferase LarE [Nitrososphaera sp.]
MKGIEDIVGWFCSTGSQSAVVALSGGVDSALVAAAAKRAFGSRAVAITADYKTLSKEELTSARRVAEELAISHRIITYSELENPDFVKNDEMRCYHCRTELGDHLRAESKRMSISLIVDGTNADDLLEHRPGIQAMREAGIKSPLAELGFGKAAVRQVAEQLGLSVYDKPSNACLASRLPTGTAVTPERLRRIEEAEAMVKSCTGVRQLRVRDHGDIARVEVARNEFQKILDPAILALIDGKLKSLGFRHVALDCAGYRSGSLVVIDGTPGGSHA